MIPWSLINKLKNEIIKIIFKFFFSFFSNKYAVDITKRANKRSDSIEFERIKISLQLIKKIEHTKA